MRLPSGELSPALVGLGRSTVRLLRNVTKSSETIGLLSCLIGGLISLSFWTRVLLVSVQVRFILFSWCLLIVLRGLKIWMGTPRKNTVSNIKPDKE